MSKVKLAKDHRDMHEKYNQFFCNNVPHVQKLIEACHKEIDVSAVAIQFYKRKHVGGYANRLFELAREFRSHLMKFSGIDPEYVYGRNRIDYLIVACAYEAHDVILKNTDGANVLPKFNTWRNLYRSSK